MIERAREINIPTSEQLGAYDLGFSYKNYSQRNENGDLVRNDTITDLLFFPQSQQTNTGYLHNLEAHAGNITLGLSATTESRDEDLVVLIDKV